MAIYSIWSAPVTLDDHLLLFRTYTGSSTTQGTSCLPDFGQGPQREGDYWDWDDSNAPVIMTTNQDISIDILRAKPIIDNLVDVEYDEDSGRTPFP